jgi:hypothetical protein
MTNEEAAARAVNAEPWEPMPGMMKRQCPECRYFFAAPIASAVPLCPDCTSPTRTAHLSEP